MSAPRLRARLLALALLLAIGGTAQAAAICTVIVDSTTFYVSEPFAYTSDKDPLFDDGIEDTAQARDFEAHVRRQYGIRGDVERSCHVHEDGEIRKEGDYNLFGTNFRYIQTGYVPRAD